VKPQTAAFLAKSLEFLDKAQEAQEQREPAGMITLYQYPDSGNCYKVRLLLSHLGKPFRTVAVSSRDGSTRQPEFLVKNPIGRVPTIEFEDGRCLAQLPQFEAV
jgi:hypothetical protein